MADEKTIPVREAVDQVLAQAEGPISLDELAQRVLAIRPSKARSPIVSLRNQLRWEEGKSLAFLDPRTIVPLRLALKGARFRICLTEQEAKQGRLRIEPAFYGLLRPGIAHPDMRLLDATGQPLSACVVTWKEEFQAGPLGSLTYEVSAFDLGGWLRTHRARQEDSVLVTIEDWEHGRFHLEHEPVSRRCQPEIERKNQELADRLFEMLEAASSERLYVQQALPTAYARLSDPRGYPGDHWTEVVERDPRMRWDGSDIRYSDARSTLERLLFPQEEEEALREEPATRAQARQVYRFKAAFRHRPGLWRRIEIQGGQSLDDFDTVLRKAFRHDLVDHLSGFWRLVRRGTGQRFREIKLGSSDPFGEGSGMGQDIAGLGLKPGDELKYVYDFGDWVEHQIVMEEVIEPEPKAKYPRIVEQSKPRHHACQGCKSKGRKAVASWICVDCSNARQQNVRICEACREAEHEDHHAEEIVY